MNSRPTAKVPFSVRDVDPRGVRGPPERRLPLRAERARDAALRLREARGRAGARAERDADAAGSPARPPAPRRRGSVTRALQVLRHQQEDGLRRARRAGPEPVPFRAPPFFFQNRARVVVAGRDGASRRRYFGDLRFWARVAARDGELAAARPWAGRDARALWRGAISNHSGCFEDMGSWRRWCGVVLAAARPDLLDVKVVGKLAPRDAGAVGDCAAFGMAPTPAAAAAFDRVRAGGGDAFRGAWTSPDAFSEAQFVVGRPASRGRPFETPAAAGGRRTRRARRSTSPASPAGPTRGT